MSKTATVHAQQRWEYMELTRKTEGYLVNELNELGGAGWELVAVFYHKELKSGLGAAECWTAFLKRPHAGHAPSASTQEKAASASAAISGPVRLEPSDTAEEMEFAEAPSEEVSSVVPPAES